MRFFLNLTNREKIIVSFLVLLLLLNGFTILVTHHLTDLSSSFKSMLEDRLIPSSDLARIQEELYQSRIALMERMLAHKNSNNIPGFIAQKNVNIDRITLKFSKTYLTAEEEEALVRFRQQILDYRQLQEKVLQLVGQNSPEEALQVYQQQSTPAFHDLLATIHELENIQVEVGRDLYRHTKDLGGVLRIVAYLSVAIALVLTVNMLKVLHYKVK